MCGFGPILQAVAEGLARDYSGHVIFLREKLGQLRNKCQAFLKKKTLLLSKKAMGFLGSIIY